MATKKSKAAEGIKHAILRTVSVVSVLAVVVLIGLAIYFAFIRPHIVKPFATQEAEHMTNYNTEVKPNFGGCAHVRIRKP